MKYYTTVLILMFWSVACSPKKFKSDSEIEPVAPPVPKKVEDEKEELIKEPEEPVKQEAPEPVVETPKPKETPPKQETPPPKTENESSEKDKDKDNKENIPAFAVGERYDTFQYHHEGSNNVRLANIEQHYCPLAGMTLEGMDKGEMTATCEVTSDDVYLNLSSVLDGQNTSRLWCSSRCINWVNGEYYLRVSREVSKKGYKGEATKSLNRSSTSFCALNSVQFSGVIDGTESAACVIEENKDYWVLKAKYHNQTEGFQSVSTDGGVKCKADCMSWYEETHNVSSTFITYALLSGSKDQQMLAPKDYNFCALTGIEVKGLDKESERAHCEVYLDDNRWYLKADLSESSEAKVECQARCINWGELK